MESHVTVLDCTTKDDFSIGLKKAMPIALGYFPVSFTFGIMATSGGIDPLMATIISLTNVTSAGQFAGVNLIIAQAHLIEIAMTTFIINLRYMLMSLALSQKLQKMSLVNKLIIGFGVTDEIFALATLEDEKVSFNKMVGMIVGPYIGWGFGTLVGAYACTILPVNLQEAMGIALYAMFLALIVPAMKAQKPILITVLITIGISISFWYIPFMQYISNGWQVILTTIIGSLLGAILFPREETSEDE